MVGGASTTTNAPGNGMAPSVGIVMRKNRRAAWRKTIRPSAAGLVIAILSSTPGTANAQDPTNLVNQLLPSAAEQLLNNLGDDDDWQQQRQQYDGEDDTPSSSSSGGSTNAAPPRRPGVWENAYGDVTTMPQDRPGAFVDTGPTSNAKNSVSRSADDNDHSSPAQTTRTGVRLTVPEPSASVAVPAEDIAVSYAKESAVPLVQVTFGTGNTKQPLLLTLDTLSPSLSLFVSVSVRGVNCMEVYFLFWNARRTLFTPE